MQFRIAPLGLLAGLLLPGCEQTQNAPPKRIAATAFKPGLKTSRVAAPKKVILPIAPYKFDHTAYAVLPGAIGMEVRFPGARPTKLSQEELEKVDKLVARCVAAYNRAQELEYHAMVKEEPLMAGNRAHYFIDLPTYKRQVIAVRNRKGEKEVWVNCFCDTSGVGDWRRQEVLVADGGNCYFNLKINLTTSCCYDVMVNGLA